jgi:recombinational DNA repair protein RecR
VDEEEEETEEEAVVVEEEEEAPMLSSRPGLVSRLVLKLEFSIRKKKRTYREQQQQQQQHAQKNAGGCQVCFVFSWFLFLGCV